MKVAEEQRAVGELLAPEITELLDARQTAAARAALIDLLDAEVAEVLMALEAQHRVVAFRLLPRDRAAEVFAYFDQDEQEQLLASLTSEQAAAIFNALDPDDRVNFFEDAPEELAARLLSLMRPEERAETEKILEYPEQSVGRLMTTEYLTVRSEWTVGQALEHIRRYGRDAETINTLFVVDEAGRLVNHISLRKLILADPQEPVSKYLQENIETVRLHATDDREQAVRTLEKYDLPVLPVVDPGGVMVGIVTFDDVADVAEEEVTEDMQKMAGMQALDEPYLASPLHELLRKRGGWLAVLFLGETFTASAMAYFQIEIEKAAVLSAFIPLIVSSGGNSGSQASTLIIRAMAVGEVTLRDWLKVFRRELACGLLLGIFLGLIGFSRIHLWQWLGLANYDADKLGTYHIAGLYHRVGLAVAVAVVGVVLWGTLVGALLPFVLRKLRLDPATISAPLIATLVDVTGLIIYFLTAMAFLRGVLL